MRKVPCRTTKYTNSGWLNFLGANALTSAINRSYAMKHPTLKSLASLVFAPGHPSPTKTTRSLFHVLIGLSKTGTSSVTGCTVYALANIPGFGASVHHDIYCQALAKVVTDPGTELREYILRDTLNLALRNTDNHGRNNAILRVNGNIALSPLFDFAPMFLDPEGINRVSRWKDERPGSQPDWAAICEKLKYALDPMETRVWVATLSEEVKKLPDIMRACQVDDEIIERLTRWIDDVATGLKSAQPKTSG